MTLGGTRAEWNALLHRVATKVTTRDATNAVIAMTERLFDMPRPDPLGRPPKVTKRHLAKIIVQMAAGKTDVAETVCPSNGIDQRTFWRYFQKASLPEFQRQLRTVWHMMFLMAVRRFGLMRLGYEVYIDEHQTLLFIKNRRKRIKAAGKEVWEWNHDGGKGSELGIVAGPSKKDKYSGKFQSMMYQCMVARFVRSGVMLPLDVVLVAKEGSVLPDGSRVPSFSKEWIMDHFIGVLEALYPPPRLIMFDRGYHANQNYVRVERYCRRHGCRYLTPAVRQPSDAFRGSDGITYSNIEDFIRRNLVNAKPVKRGSDAYYFLGEKPVTGSPDVHRTLMAFLRPREEGRDMPESAVELDETHYAFVFYTNDPNPEPLIAWWERAYSRRWNQENWFKKRSTNFHDGRANKVLRRMAVFMTGILCLAVYGLMQGHQYPEHDVLALSRRFSVPKFATALLVRLDTG